MAVKNMKPPRGNNIVNKKKNDPSQLILVSQEISFAKMLAGNEKKTRDKVLKMLKGWISMRVSNAYDFQEDDFMRIWQGLFYSVWMSDKPLIQEDLCESISQIMNLFGVNCAQHAVLFFSSGLKTLATEWYGLDQHRLDKFLMLVRRLIRGIFRYLRKCEWSIESCQKLSNALTKVDGLFAASLPHYARNALSLQLHIVDCWLEELSKISEGNIKNNVVVELVRPFLEYMGRGDIVRLCGSINTNIFIYLIRQTDLALDHQAKAEIWKSLGCPKGGIDALTLADSDDEDNVKSDNEDDNDNEDNMDDDDDDDEDKETQDDEGEEVQENDDDLNDEDNTPKRKVGLDTRAGHVDVILAPLPVDAKGFISVLRPLLKDRASTVVHRRRVKACLQHLDLLSKGVYSFKMDDKIEHAKGPSLTNSKCDEIVEELQQYEKKLVVQSDELQLKGLNKKKRKRILKRAQEKFMNGGVEPGTENDVEEESLEDKNKRVRHDSNNSLDATTTAGDWQVEDSEPLISITKKRKRRNKKATTDNAEDIDNTWDDAKKISAEKETAESDEEDKSQLKRKRKNILKRGVTVEASKPVILYGKKALEKIKSGENHTLDKKTNTESTVEASKKVVLNEKTKKESKIEAIQTPNRQSIQESTVEVANKVVLNEKTPKKNMKDEKDQSIQKPSTKSKRESTVEDTEKLVSNEKTPKKSKKDGIIKVIQSPSKKSINESTVEVTEDVVSNEKTPKKSKRDKKDQSIQSPSKKLKGECTVQVTNNVVLNECTLSKGKKYEKVEAIQSPNKKSEDLDSENSVKSSKNLESAKKKIKTSSKIKEIKGNFEKSETKVNGKINKQSPKPEVEMKQEQKIKSLTKTQIMKTPVRNSPALIKDTPKSAISPKDGTSPKNLSRSPKSGNRCPKTAETPENIKKTPVIKDNKQNVDKTVSTKKSPLNVNGKRSAELENAASTPKRVKIVLKNNTAQQPIDYYRSIRQSPNIPFDSDKKPMKTNLKPNSTPSPINPFFKKKARRF